MASTITGFSVEACYLIRMIKLLSFSLLAAGLALVACSDNKSSGSSSTCSNYAAALQSATAKCGSKQAGLPADQLAAEASRLTTICTNALNAPGNGITAAAVDACATRIQSSCLEDDACDDLSNARGSLPDGAVCGTPAQCSGGDCKRSSAGDTSCGTCGQLAAIGAACGPGMPSCVRDATCQTATAGGNATCVAQPSNLAEGATCYDPKAPTSFGRCASGLACKGGTGSGTVSKCAKRGATGDACTSSGECTADLSCVAKACAAPQPEGAACTNGSECASGACASETRKCTTPTYGAAGAVCNGQELRCLRGDCATGDTSTGKCVDPLADGAACTTAGTSSSKGPYCDHYATCEKGTCQLFDPATCK